MQLLHDGEPMATKAYDERCCSSVAVNERTNDAQ